MSTQTIICLVVFVATLALYMSNKFPLPLVSMTAMGIYVITGCLEPSAALSCFSNSSVIIMGSMFIVAGGLNRTQMVHKVTDLAYKVSGGNFYKGLILYCLVTLAIAQVAPSAILIFSICYPLVADFCRKNNESPSKAMFSIVLICICTVTSLPIGSGATSYITANSLWETYGLTAKEGMFDPMLVYMPTLILSVLFAMFYCPKVAPDYGPLYTDVQLKQLKEQKPLDPFREFFVAVVIAILFSNYLPATIPTWMICFIGAVLTILTGVLSEKEAMEALTMPPIFLYIGSLAVGNALVASGAGTFIAEGIQSILGDNPSKWVVIIMFWLAGFIVTQFMSNMALYSALQPVVLLMCATYGWNPTGLYNMLWKATFTSYLTPLSTVAIPLCMAVGGYKQKDLIRMGLLPALVISVANILWCGLMFPPY
mgnify:CR=1 FL=1